MTMALWISVLAANLEVGAGKTYSTIGEAAAVATAGDVVRVYPGTYPENLDLSASGADGLPIRIESVRPLAAVLQGAIEIGGNDWHLVGLTVEVPDGPDGVQIRGARIVLEGLDLSGGTRDGIDGGGVDVTVRDSSIHNFDAGDSDAHCIVINPGAERWVIEDNTLFDCSGDGIQLFAETAERTILETTIRRNQIYYTGDIARMENAIDVKNADGLRILNNTMWGFSQNKTLVFQKGPADIEVMCNEMSQGFTGVEFRGEDGGTLEGVVFAHNLMVDFQQYALKFDGVVGASVHNNTFIQIDGDGLRLEGQSLAAGSIQNNLWVSTTQVESDGDLVADHNGFWLVQDNQIGSATDINADPLLDADYRLPPRSPMVDAGVDVGLPFAGVAPDIGWAELDGNPCEETPSPPDDGGGDSGSDSGVDETGGGGTEGGAEAGGSPGSSGGSAAAGQSGVGTDGAASGTDESGANGCGCQARGKGDGSYALGFLLLVVARRRRFELGAGPPATRASSTVTPSRRLHSPRGGDIDDESTFVELETQYTSLPEGEENSKYTGGAHGLRSRRLV